MIRRLFRRLRFNILGYSFVFVGITVLVIVLILGTWHPKPISPTVTTNASTVTEQTRSEDGDNDGIPDTTEDNLIHKFAPVVKLHPDEQYFPANISWFLTRVKMRFDIRMGLDVTILNRGDVNQISLLSQVCQEQLSGLCGETTDFFLEQTDVGQGDSLDSYRKETRVGTEPSEWVCYAHVRPAPPDHAGMYDIQYIFFYAYNGDMTLGVIESAHEADFEHITVRVESDLSNINGIYYAAHDEEGKWYQEGTSKGSLDGYSISQDGHPIVYSALSSHASYPWADQWKRSGKPDDLVGENGFEWSTMQNIVNVGEKGHPETGMSWIQYSGHWGEIGLFSWTTGPFGPAYQSWWISDPVE